MIISSISIIKKLIILFLVIAGLYFAKDFLIPLSIGAVLATLLLPFSNWLESKKIPRGLAAFCSVLVIIFLIGFVFALIGWQVAELTNDITLIKEKAMESINRIQEFIINHLAISAEQQTQVLKNQQHYMNGILSQLAGSTHSIFTSMILVLVYISFLLYYRRHIKQFILQLSPISERAEMEQVVLNATHVSQQYLLGLAKMIVCLWIMYSIGFSVVGVESAIFFAILCGLLEIVPYIGNITGTTLTVFVAAVHGASFPLLGGIVVTYAIVQLIQGWILEPIILGPQVKINPLFTIISLVMGELIWEFQASY
ncbi:MAG: AI-2E family transporter [Saprospiraceae bacterium]|nr:AI-2E family transporter [Saprospiraceae bacterium]